VPEDMEKWKLKITPCSKEYADKYCCQICILAVHTSHGIFQICLVPSHHLNILYHALLRQKRDLDLVEVSLNF
jgi:hypothetical protein